jgi:NADH:ubiquinone oxidoreductase subunit 6 (subunit J)
MPPCSGSVAGAESKIENHISKMSAALALIALLTVGSAAVAMALRNLIHSALLLVASWAGIAAFYLWAGAEFVAFAQVLVYVGAVSMIVLFAVLLTRRSREDLNVSPGSIGRMFGAMVVGGGVFGTLVSSIIATDLPEHGMRPPAASVRQLGIQLMSTHTASLLIVGLILTVALIGAVVIAATDSTTRKGPGK